MRRAVRRRGSVLVEAVLLIPILLALLIGTVQLGRITYTYYMLEKVMLNLARSVGVHQTANFCDSEDPALIAAINYALTGDETSSDNPVVPGLAPSMFLIRTERYDSNAEQMVACECSAAGCDRSQGSLPPSYIVVSLVDGYVVNTVFWGLPVTPIALHPSVRVPYAGT